MSQPEKLSINQKKYLRGIAHGLNPIIIIGANGVTESLMAELDSTLSHHELLKIKIASAEREDRKEMIDYVVKATGALLVQSIGKTFVIYRQNEETNVPLPKK
ncbi:ribosome assembly RNA-binding protein YhbY [Thiomicrorhabdus cannonii]|uniref:ribosome assembly RNA-binding protein YhbY n=1 Tax=Thiomicrorhabdus cannonii TaxID=2748011 RepID=UPI0015BE86AA|nr:ribosome assembly RNA-binding protein YhbY [Thiomicrorhabdus cannonii]